MFSPNQSVGPLSNIDMNAMAPAAEQGTSRPSQPSRSPMSPDNQTNWQHFKLMQANWGHYLNPHQTIRLKPREQHLREAADLGHMGACRDLSANLHASGEHAASVSYALRALAGAEVVASDQKLTLSQSQHQLETRQIHFCKQIKVRFSEIDNFPSPINKVVDPAQADGDLSVIQQAENLMSPLRKALSDLAGPNPSLCWNRQLSKDLQRITRSLIAENKAQLAAEFCQEVLAAVPLHYPDWFPGNPG